MIGALVLMLLETTPPAWAASAHVIVDGPALLQQLDIDFDRERSTTVMIAFPDRSTALTSYAEALAAVNLPSSRQPDLVVRDSREWRDLQGYFVKVIAACPAPASMRSF